MPELSAAIIDEVVEACRRNCASIAESLNRCFDTQFTLRPGEAAEWDATSLAEGQPGLLVTLQIGNQGLLVAIPETMPLPDWYLNPGESEKARLGTLSMEWSLNLLPDEFSVDQFDCRQVGSLSEAVAASRPVAGAVVLPFFLEPRASEVLSGTSPGAVLSMIGPVENPECGTTSPVASVSPARRESPQEESAASFSGCDQATARDQSRRIRQILKLKVPVIVKLAEKRIQLGQLLALGPGAIVTFEKSCEDLLDLCVNNQVYCRGEAVKIGEKFGLKVNEIAEVRVLSDSLDG